MITAAWGQNGPGALPIIDGAMTVQTDNSLKTALHEAEMEIRHLHGTIAALRQELEEQRAAKDQAVQQASADAQGEIKQLRDTVRALRDELESLQHSKQDAVQKANADFAGEIGDEGVPRPRCATRWKASSVTATTGWAQWSARPVVN